MSPKSKNQKISETIVELVSYIIFLVLFLGTIYPSSPLFALVSILVVTLILIYAVWKSYSDDGSLV
jgi:4-hydroxybenzoate polyprenyltransferase